MGRIAASGIVDGRAMIAEWSRAVPPDGPNRPRAGPWGGDAPGAGRVGIPHAVNRPRAGPWGGVTRPGAGRRGIPHAANRPEPARGAV